MQLDVTLAIGGTDQKQFLPTAAVVIATPGRLIDLINCGRVRLEALKLMILDEADEMLSRGFAE
ncbi:MAG: DEAD/DEAH box helicase [Kangiellaceae bacterium]|jgi:superfamily II DNA/RNA helicase|nr:DEAD/DEAH box helicase [Kangiellaceae bacterium]